MNWEVVGASAVVAALVSGVITLLINTMNYGVLRSLLDIRARILEKNDGISLENTKKINEMCVLQLLLWGYHNFTFRFSQPKVSGFTS